MNSNQRPQEPAPEAEDDGLVMTIKKEGCG